MPLGLCFSIVFERLQAAKSVLFSVIAAKVRILAVSRPAFADFIAFSAPEAIVLFGGLARAKDFLREPIERAMNANVLPLWRDKVKIVFSQLKESDAAILGASALAWEL